MTVEIPSHILKSFNLLPNRKRKKSSQSVFTPPVDDSTLTPPPVEGKLEYSPIGCDPGRKTVKISKVGKKDKGNFVVVNYRKTSRAFAEKVRRSKFDCFQEH